jgi:uncharacterized protein (TIGR02646 family)
MTWRQYQDRKLVIKDRLYVWQHGKCAYCGKKLDKCELTVDHVFPRSRGGRLTLNNALLACVECNREKADSLPSLFNLAGQYPWLNDRPMGFAPG